MCRTLPFALAVALAGAGAPAADWPDWRGPARDGRSAEIGLPSRWSPAGENLLWKAPYGCRSAPIVMGGRVYVQNAAGKGETLQERVVCLDADTGKLIWEYRFNVYPSDVPPHRVGWASPVGDPATGNVYAFGVGGTLLALTATASCSGNARCREEFGLVTTHGGRTVVAGHRGRARRLSAASPRAGATRRAAATATSRSTRRPARRSGSARPAGRHYDTNYSPPVAADVNGTRLLIVGGSDGAIHALKAQTGEPVWNFEMSKRGNQHGRRAARQRRYRQPQRGEPRYSEMGLLAAVDATRRGHDRQAAQIKWTVTVSRAASRRR